jgi:hypothetical protein
MASKHLHGYRSYPFQLVMDHLFAIFIICILLAMAVRSYSPYRETAKLCHVLGSPYIEMKWDMMLFHAQHGVWPKTNQEAIQNGWAQTYGNQYSPDYVKDAVIENGAIHFNLGEAMKGSVVTMRPAVPAKDSLGPVVWVSGKSNSIGKWTIYGLDRTDVDARYIPPSWR